MVIVSSEVRMRGAYQRREEVSRKEEVRVWNSRPGNSSRSNTQDTLELSAEGRKVAAMGLKGQAKTNQQVWELSEKDKQKILILMKMLKALTGKDFKIHLPELLKEPTKVVVTSEENEPSISGLGWGISVDLHELYYEYEKMLFSAQGTLRTADGGEINFQVELKLEREYREETRFILQMGDAPLTDPLVINFRNGDAGLSGLSHPFDLSGEGRLQYLPYLSPGSGYLAIDRDGDGSINNGLELFGPATGNGFAELAAFDQDRNGWIDEGDSVFDHLKIWIKTAEGDEQRENGSVGTIQQLDIRA